VVLAALLGIVIMVLGFPLLMVQFSGSRLPWDKLADVGDAYGGASALLSAAAMCGVGASLVYQQRQLRQEMVMIERQQHFELVKLAIEDKDLMRAVDGGLAASPEGKQQAYANLTMNYWLSMWELGEIDDEELQGLTAVMFQSRIARTWWLSQEKTWLGTRFRPQRARFMAFVSEQCAAAASSAAATPAVPTPVPTPRSLVRGTALITASLVVAGAVIRVRQSRVRSRAC